MYRAGFLHLPLMPEMAVLQPQPAPSMSLDTMRRAVEIAVAVSQVRHSKVPITRTVAMLVGCHAVQGNFAVAHPPTLVILYVLSPAVYTITLRTFIYS